MASVESTRERRATTAPATLVEAASRLRLRVRRLKFAPPVAYVYNPLDYAWPAHEAWLEAWGRGMREVLLVGMNPGPFGMVQTGVPFGEVAIVRDWLRIRREIGRPRAEHPRRPVLGLECARSEVSGARLWGWARQRYGTPAAFFRRFFITNYCPLAFVEESGRNRTPDKLPREEQSRLFAACDAALRDVVRLMRPRWVVGIGAFAEARAGAALEGVDVQIGRIPHPSPASPAANRDWAGQAEQALAAMGVTL